MTGWMIENSFKLYTLYLPYGMEAGLEQSLRRNACQTHWKLGQ